MIRQIGFVVALVAVGVPAFAQTARAAAPPESDAIAVLTREIRALRQEIAETARASLRLQLLTARIQAQEQRIIYLDRQRAEAVTRRAGAEQVRSALATQVQMFAGGDTSKLTAEQRKEVEPMLAMFKQQMGTHDSAIAQLQTEETDAANALATEQARWADLNQRLEDLERGLK